MRLTAATAKYFHEQARLLACACGVEAYDATTAGTGAPGSSLLATLHHYGRQVAASAPGCYTIAAAIGSLRNALIVGGHLRLADVNQQQCLMRLYNSPLATRAEKQAMLQELPGLYVDEVGERYKSFKAVLEQRDYARRQRPGRVAGVAELVRLQPQAA